MVPKRALAEGRKCVADHDRLSPRPNGLALGAAEHGVTRGWWNRAGAGASQNTGRLIITNPALWAGSNVSTAVARVAALRKGRLRQEDWAAVWPVFAVVRNQQ